MKDDLTRLLEAEDKAQAIIDEAMRRRDRMVEEANAVAERAQQQFEARIPELHKSFSSKGEERAAHTVAELERRFQERLEQLQQMADEHREEAIAAALKLILEPEQA
jgi:hypothetical protein